ncbi:hypothetical protein H4J02_09230 [Protaetiibacter sp. SSC-01]|uniref:hypothetical protein n=1 Tax=Protaetiibacter sp. SSC-01 TaxID=2759943 RepID=UPI001656BF07|nr:hypothetical protein [Protaetiibacter sp. SSC-01]QNO36677.1 hypothetical protein H4J02_09230 [Protaetiibacter sp. SSC-01]
MSGLLALLLVALAAAALAAIASALVVLRRAGRLGMRQALASGGLAVLTALATTAGIAALQPAAPVATVVEPAAVVDVQLPTLALEE